MEEDQENQDKVQEEIKTKISEKKKEKEKTPVLESILDKVDQSLSKGTRKKFSRFCHHLEKDKRLQNQLMRFPNLEHLLSKAFSRKMKSKALKGEAKFARILARHDSISMLVPNKKFCPSSLEWWKLM